MNPGLSLLLIVCMAAVAVRLRSAPEIGQLVARALNAPLAPWIAGAVTMAVTGWAWGSLRASGVIHDESAYVLQSELFAHLRWTAPARPLPEFFEQLHVFVTPVLASKYPPGTSMLIAPGTMVGLPGLPIVLVNGLTGVLIFAVARRVGGAAVALLTVVVWLSAYPVIYAHAMYLSEVPSGFAWIGAWWGLLRWRRDGRRSGLLVVAAAVGSCALTRPLTAVALAAPIAVVVARHAWTDPRRRRDLVAAFALTLAFVMVIPVWNWRTTGNARTDPLSLYSRVYFPFVKLGFGIDTAARPLRPLPADLAMTSAAFESEHEAHTLRAIPTQLVERMQMIGRDMWFGWRAALLVFAVIGLVVMPAPREGWVPVSAFALQILIYLAYAHPAMWSLYYLEGQPLLAFLTAGGLAWICLRVAGADAPGRMPRGTFAAALLAVVALAPAYVTIRQVRAQIAADHAYYDRFRAALATIRDRRAVVFVRYAPTHNDNLSLVRNVADLAAAPVWTVYDRGADDIRLLRIAPDRVPYLFDEASWRLYAVGTQRTPSARLAPGTGGERGLLAGAKER